MRMKKSRWALALLGGVATLSFGAGRASVAATSVCTGSWSVQAQPGAELNGVGVGGAWLTGSSGGKGLLLRRAGDHWTRTTFPSVAAITGIASDGRSTWAVGVRSVTGNLGGDYVFRQDGKRWVRVRVPGLPATKLGARFTAVDVAGGDVWLAGTWAYEGRATEQMVDPGGSGWLTARLHAGRWQTWKGRYSEWAGLSAIDARGARDAWAVGHQGPMSVSAEEVLLHWNGLAWVDMSNYDDVYSLAAVLAVGHRDVWAAGTTNLDRPGTSAKRPAIKHWTGTRWARLTMPAWRWPVAPSLTSLTTFGKNDVWAGGARFNGPPALLHWDGSQWREATPPPVKTAISGLAAGRDGTLWAVGSHFVASARCG